MNVLSFAEAIAASSGYSKRHLLLGNGFSIACRPDIFRYDKLFEQADFSALPDSAKSAFSVLHTTDFERVIKVLRDSAALAAGYGVTDAQAEKQAKGHTLSIISCSVCPVTHLVQEAKTRQVIVFTHDVVFLLLLKQFAKELEVEQFDQHVRFLSKGAGVCSEELPWVALPIKKKISYLKNGWQSADKLSRDGHQDVYEKDAKYLYGLLREAWERALEEVLLGGVVERYRPNIQTQQVAQIADITPEDCKPLETAMTKCSKWLPGHDQAAAARAPVPGPAELKADIEALENWVAVIRNRRK